jgi:DNA-3-methyladenine glycosylase II
VSDAICYEAGDTASSALAAADPLMADLIARVGSVEFQPMRGDRFAVLVRSVVGQQLSGKAASTIYGRLSDRIGITPQALSEASADELLGVGLSHRKAEYVRGIAQAAQAGDIDLATVDDLDDDEIIAQLTGLRGVGRWTAHMFLLFALGRPDVIAADDLGVQQAAGRVMGLGRAATRKEVEAAAERWRPYRSAATLYLYREAGMEKPAGGHQSESR